MRWLIAALLMFPVVASAQEGFQLSSGNIFCDIDDNAIRCDLTNHTFPNPPLPAGCDASFGWGHAYSVGATGAPRVLCGGDTVVNRGARVLRAGSQWRGQGVTCNAERASIRCTNGEGRGFEITRAKLTLF